MKITLSSLFIILPITLGVSGCQGQVFEKPENLIDISGIWKNDTCGMSDDRVIIAELLIKHKSKFIGLPVEFVEEYFGIPDDTIVSRSFDNVIELYYSTSSISGQTGDCGEATTSSFSVLVDTASSNIVDLRAFIH